MGMTKSNARSGPEKRRGVTRRIAPLKLALGALALLMVSGVLAQSGAGYDLQRWTVAGGGAISGAGGAYALGSTVGQTGAGVASGGDYTIYGGFWKPGTVLNAPPNAVPAYLPLIIKSPPPPPTPTPPPTPACNDVENNDTPQQAKALTTIGTTCLGSLQDDPQGEDDWYSIDLAAGKTISIDLTGIPTGADYDLIFCTTSGNSIVASSKENNTDEHLVYRSAAAGHYTIRIFMYRKSTTTTNTYRLGAAIT